MKWYLLLYIIVWKLKPSIGVTGDFAIMALQGSNTIQMYTFSNGQCTTLPLQGLNGPTGVGYDPVQKKIYWTESSGRKIGRCDIDGSNQETVTSNLDDAPYGLALDIEARLMFWSSEGTGGSVKRASLDGSDQRAIVTGSLYATRHLYLDSTNRLLYVADVSLSPGEIHRMNTDGGDKTRVIRSDLSSPLGIVMDEQENRLLWSGYSEGSIQSSNLSGDDQKILYQPQSNPYLTDLALYGDYIYFTNNGWPPGLYKIPKSGNSAAVKVTSCGTGAYGLHIHVGTDSDVTVLCNELIAPNNGFLTPSGPHYAGAEVMAMCQEGYQISGPGRLFCQQDGTWSGEVAMCEEKDKQIVQSTNPSPLSTKTTTAQSSNSSPLSTKRITVLSSNSSPLSIETTTTNLSPGDNTQSLSSAALIAIVAGIFLLIIIIVVGLRIWKIWKSNNSLTPDDEIKLDSVAVSSLSAKLGKTNSATTKEVCRENITLLKEIGHGAFGVVYQAVMKVTKKSSKLVAVKMLKANSSETARNDFVKELNLYKTLDHHPNVISIVGTCTKKDPMYLILEYAPNGNLKSHLDNLRTEELGVSEGGLRNHLSPRELLTFAHQIASGMTFLSSKECVHRDLATRNILLGENMVCKLSDFGLARELAGEQQYEMKSSGRVPVRWMAPESVLHNLYTTKSDVWSFGVLVWELVTLGAHPYPGMSSRQLIDAIKNGYRLPKPEHCSEEIFSVMTNCWKVNPKMRPAFTELQRQLGDMLPSAQGYIAMDAFNENEYEYMISPVQEETR